ncbi:MAG TPA: hypothetical protein VLF94_00100 [Chlamydiales bacterium]|nr:hypothetical protein [Chlamydiales bacterium]
MNILGLVFSLLLILSYGFYACWDKQTASNRLRTTYVGHERANRKILNSYQSEVYKHLGRKAKPATEAHAASLVEEEELPDEEQPQTQAKKPDPNHQCAKLNLWPLIQEGRECHPMLYELTANLIRTFYAPLSDGAKRFEYRLLDALLAAAKAFPRETPFAFEKILLPHYPLTYYKMLKGTKEWDLSAHVGYPPLLDYIKADPSKDKICLFHAHPDALTVLFGPTVAASLYSTVHQQGGPALTRELVEKHCSDARLLNLDPDLLALFEYGHPDHPEHKKTLIAHDHHISLRKTVYLQE